MTTMEDKERELRPMHPPSSDYTTIVPIKKRRFPIYGTPSPPPEGPCSILGQNEKQQESTSVSQGSAILNITSEEGKPEKLAISQPAEGSCSILGQNEKQQESTSASQGSAILNIASEEGKPEKLAISQLAGGPCSILGQNEKQQESTSASQGSAILNIASEEGKPEKLAISQPAEGPCSIRGQNEKQQESTFASQGSAILNITSEEGKPEKLAISQPAEGPCSILGQNEKQQESTSACQGSAILNITSGEGKPEKLAISQGASSSSALQQSGYASANQDKLESLSVNPALTNGGNSFDYSICVMKSESNVTDLCTNRSNWDLNTTMDAWEGSNGDATSIRAGYLHGTATASGDRVDTKPLESPTEIAGVDVLNEQFAAEGQSAEVGAASFVPSANTQTQDDTLKLGLQIPSPSNLSQETAHFSPGFDPNTIFSRVSSAGSSGTVPSVAVKSEPCEEAQKKACLGTASGDFPSLVGKLVKCETFDRGGLEFSSSSLKLLNSRSVLVKDEPTYEATSVALSMNEETSNRFEQISQGMVLESGSKVTEPRPVNFPLANEYQTISNFLEDGRPVKEDTDYEDGEVQDRIVADGPAGHVDAAPVENVSESESEPKNMESAGDVSYQCADSPLQNREDNEMQLCSEMEETLLDEKSQMSFGLDTHLQDLSDAEVDSGTNEAATFAQGIVVMAADENPMISPVNARISTEATISDHEGSGASAQGGNAIKTENNVSHDDAEKNDSILPKAQSSVNSEAVGGDSNRDSNRSRIINLSATLKMPSSGKTHSAPDRSAPLHDGRRRLPNVALERDKLHVQGRNEVRDAHFHRFSRERNQDMFSRNSRSGFARDRGRFPNNMCSDWESEQDFSSEMHNGPLEFRDTRYRYKSDYRSYNVSPEDGFVGTGRGGRKLLTDNSANFHVQHSLRRANGGRDDPARGPPMVGRLQRNMSPSRCISVEDSELVGVRHGFAQRERNIGSFSGNSLHRIHSKSPVRLRSRSPIQWSSPRRRSPEGFPRHPEMAPIRSPPMFRRERMGSPDRSCYRGEVMMRRQNSPPYISRQLDDMREMNSGRDRGFSRTIMHNGNSSIRSSFRTRRYDMVNSRERTHGEYFRVPMHDARFRELSGDENTDERTRLNEKRGPVRRFRPHCGSENKGFTYSSSDGSRFYRPCPEDDSDYHEGGNSGEGQRERHPKSEPRDIHKTRKNEDREGSFGQELSDELDDMPRHKREKF